MSSPERDPNALADTDATQTEVLTEQPTRDRDGRFLPRNPFALKHGLRSELTRSGKLLEEHPTLIERRDRVRNGDMSEVHTSLANSFVAADVIASGFAAKIALEGPLTGKGHAKSLVLIWMKVSEHRNRLAQLLGYEPPKPDTAPTGPSLDALLSGLTDDELSTVKAIFERAAERKQHGEQPDLLPVKPDETIIELPDEETFYVDLPPETDDVE